MENRQDSLSEGAFVDGTPFVALALAVLIIGITVAFINAVDPQFFPWFLGEWNRR